MRKVKGRREAARRSGKEAAQMGSKKQKGKTYNSRLNASSPQAGNSPSNNEGDRVRSRTTYGRADLEQDDSCYEGVFDVQKGI